MACYYTEYYKDFTGFLSTFEHHKGQTAEESVKRNDTQFKKIYYILQWPVI